MWSMQEKGLLFIFHKVFLLQFLTYECINIFVVKRNLLHCILTISNILEKYYDSIFKSSRKIIAISGNKHINEIDLVTYICIHMYIKKPDLIIFMNIQVNMLKDYQIKSSMLSITVIKACSLFQKYKIDKCDQEYQHIKE